MANGKGLTSRASSPPRSASPNKLHTGLRFDHPGKTFEGSISFIAKPDTAQMVHYTEQVRRNSPYHPEQFRQAPEDELNRILWAVARPGEPDPAPIHRALFTKPME